MTTATSVLPARIRGRASAYAPEWSGVLAGALAFGLTLALAAASGGYFARTWGLTALVLSWIAALALVLRERIYLGRLEQVTLGAFAALLGWTALSSLWSGSASPPLREAGRTAIYVACLLAALVVVRSRSYRTLLIGVWAAAAVACAYGLATRLFPERLADSADFASYRLDEPIGYWNGLGIFCVLGTLLAVGIAARGRAVALRALAGGSTVIFLTTLYFTFSRGAWVALGVGLVTLLATDQRRLHLLATLAAVAPWSALALWSASGHEALTRPNPVLALAAEQGRELAGVVVALVVAAAVCAVALALLESRVRVGRRMRLGIAVALAAAAVAGLGAIFATEGSPVTLAERAYDELDKPVVSRDQDLQSRLFQLSNRGRIAHWRVAWDQYLDDPVLGSGAGTYERQWLQHRPSAGPVRDAHSLYLEILTELGPIGLGLLLVALGAPVVAALQGRRRALVPAALAAYVAFLAHAGIDWDWEMPAVTVTGLLCAVAILVSARGPGADRIPLPVRGALLAGTAVLAAFSFAGFMGSHALVASKDADENDQPAKAEAEARKATRWLPWSTEPWQAVAEAHFDRDDFPRARTALLEALERDRGDWAIWFDLGAASTGRERERAFREAARLNPYSRNVGVLRTLGVLPPLPSTTESGSSGGRR